MAYLNRLLIVASNKKLLRGKVSNPALPQMELLRLHGMTTSLVVNSSHCRLASISFPPRGVNLMSSLSSTQNIVA